MRTRNDDHSGRTIHPAKSASSLAQNPVEKFLRLFERHAWLYIILIFFCLTSATIFHFLRPSYKTKATLMLQAAINNPLQSLSARLGGFSGFDVDGREVDRYLNQLRIHSFYERAARDVQADPDLGAVALADFAPVRHLRILPGRPEAPEMNLPVRDISVARVAASLQEMVAYSKDGIDAFSIHVQSSSAELVSRLTNLVARSAVNALIEFDVQDLQDSEVYLKIQAKKSEDEIRKTEAAIAEFKRSKNLLSISQNFDEAALRSSELKRALSEVQLQIDQNRSEIAKVIASDAATAPEPFDYKFGVRRKLASLRAFEDSLKVKAGGIQAQIQQLRARFDERSEQKLMELKKSLELQTSLHQELKKHDFQMEMRRISARNKFHLLEPSRPDVVEPRESLASKLALSLVGALVFASLLAFLIETANPLAASRQDVDETGLTVLGSLPNGHAASGLLGSLIPKRMLAKRVIPALMNQRITSAAMQICTRIMEIRDRATGGHGHVISVTSSEPGEGKTFTSERIACALAACDNKVLLVDGDLRAPALSERFRSLGKKGLCEVVGHRELFGQFRITRVSKGVDLLPAGQGRSNPTGLLASREFSQLLNDFRAIYDFVVIDSAPVGVSGDSTLIAKNAEIPVMIVAMNESRLRMLHSAVDALGGVNDGTIYAVLNKVPPSQIYGYGNYGRGNYPSIAKMDPEVRERVKLL